MNLSQLEKRFNSVSSHRAQWASADDPERIRADIEGMSEPELDQVLANLFVIEAGERWKQADYAVSYAEILQQVTDENMAQFPNFPPEAWPPQLIEIFEHHGVKIPD